MSRIRKSAMKRNQKKQAEVVVDCMGKVFKRQQGWFTYELTETVKVCTTRPTQVQNKTKQKISALAKESAHKVSCLSNELFTIGICCERENQFSSMEWHEVYHAHSRTGPMPRSSWPQKTNSMVFFFVCVWHFVSFCFVLEIFVLLVFGLLVLTYDFVEIFLFLVFTVFLFSFSFV